MLRVTIEREGTHAPGFFEQGNVADGQKLDQDVSATEAFIS